MLRDVVRTLIRSLYNFPDSDFQGLFADFLPARRVQFSTSKLHNTSLTNMDAILDERFQRVEAALNTLVDSLTIANPQVQAANDLHAADNEFHEGLVQCTTISLRIRGAFS